MKILIEIPDTFVPEEGDAFDAVHAALEFFEIPSAMKVLPESETEVAATIETSDPPDVGNELEAAAFIRKASAMSTDDLDDWYEAHVGYRPSVDDPSLVGNPEHAYLIAETMCLHAHGPKGTYGDLCVMLEHLRTGSSDGRTDKYFPAPSGLLKRLSALPGKSLGHDFTKAARRLTYPYFELSKEQYVAVMALAGQSDVLLFDGVTQVTFGASGGKFGLMPLHDPI